MPLIPLALSALGHIGRFALMQTGRKKLLQNAIKQAARTAAGKKYTNSQKLFSSLSQKPQPLTAQNDINLLKQMMVKEKAAYRNALNKAIIKGKVKNGAKAIGVLGASLYGGNYLINSPGEEKEVSPLKGKKINLRTNQAEMEKFLEDYLKKNPKPNDKPYEKQEYKKPSNWQAVLAAANGSTLGAGRLASELMSAATAQDQMDASSMDSAYKSNMALQAALAKTQAQKEIMSMRRSLINQQNRMKDPMAYEQAASPTGAAYIMNALNDMAIKDGHKNGVIESDASTFMGKFLNIAAQNNWTAKQAASVLPSYVDKGNWFLPDIGQQDITMSDRGLAAMKNHKVLDADGNGISLADIIAQKQGLINSGNMGYAYNPQSRNYEQYLFDLDNENQDF